MGPKGLETRRIALYHIQNLGPKELSRIDGVISKIGQNWTYGQGLTIQIERL